MHNTLSLLTAWKHEILAGLFTFVSMLLLVMLLFGEAGSAVNHVVVAKTGPLSIGTFDAEQDAPDALARSGEASSSADVIPDSGESQPSQSEMVELPDSHQPLWNEPENNTEESVQGEENRLDRPELRPDTEGEETSETSTLAHQSSPQSTPVEAAPRPVEQMSTTELAQTVEAYETWVHEGQIKLFLDYSKLTLHQLDAITQMYVARTMHSTILVSPNGNVQTLGRTEFPSGKLIGDLPPNRSKWPPVLVARARERFGSSFVADANFILTDACALTLYRTLAKALSNKTPQTGMKFVFRLEPNGKNIEIQLVHQK